MSSRSGALRVLLLAVFFGFVAGHVSGAAPETPVARRKPPAPGPGQLREDGMSAGGYLARLAVTGRLDAALAKARAQRGSVRVPLVAPGGGWPPVEDDSPLPGGQAELSIAVDVTGNHVVVGFNDVRGFFLSPVSVSGYAFSDDGGATFTDGGQLPTVSNGTIPTGEAVPQIFGDPDVKYVPGGAGCQFIYSSIMVKGFTGTAPNFTGSAQTMAIHRSTDCGHTWAGPFEITAATNPTGALAGSDARDAADKELIDVDPDTGRVMVSWSNFTVVAVIPGGVEIRAAFSDNVMSATPPTWSAGVVLNAGATTFDTGSIPRFAGNGSPNVHVAWATNGDSFTPYGVWGFGNVRVATSTNNGSTFGAPVALNTSPFFPIDHILGNDRVHSFPGLAVDNSAGPNRGNVYAAYASNAGGDGVDILFQRSTNGGTSFSTGIALNARPGSDRAQWFPYVAVDTTTGRVSVIYYDQGVASSGDVTETTWIYSDDGGVTWSKPSPLTSRPFHAGYGNDTGQPNLGDYIGCVSQGGTLFASWAGTLPLVLFTDGQPASSFTVPDFYFAKATSAKAALHLGTVTFTDSGGNGFIDPGETIQLQVPLTNYVTNLATGTVTYTGITGTLSTATPGVSITGATRSYPSAAAGATVSPASPYSVLISSAFVPGTRIEFALAVVTGQGATSLLFTQTTGTPDPNPPTVVLLSENFNGTTPGTLPAGWATFHQGGSNTVPWTTSTPTIGTTAMGSNGLFHANANDGISPLNNTRWEKVFTPNIIIPASSEYVTVDFDIAYDTEDDPDFGVLAYDGATLRVTDFTAGHAARANLVEAFAEEIRTGTAFHFPKHLPRSGNPAYFQDMSVWAGDSGGLKHVHMKLPGMAGTTVQFRFEFTQDSVSTCADVRPGHSCGVFIDNLVIKSVVSAVLAADLSITNTPSSGSITGGTNVTYTLGVANGGPSQADSVTVNFNLPAPLSFVSCLATGGGVCGGSGNNRTVTYTSLANAATSTITVVAALPCSAAHGSTVSATATVASATTPDPGTSNNSATALFIVNAALSAPAITAPAAAGAGSPNRKASVPAHALSTYAWVIGNGTITAGQGTSQITFTAGTAGTLTLSVTETNASTCVSAPGNANVTVTPAGSAMLFYTLAPCRQLDTRSGSPIAPAGTLTAALTGAPCGVPAGAKAVSVNVSETQPVALGALRIFPADGTLPLISNLNFNAGQTRANNAVLKLSGDGTGRVNIVNGSSGTVHVIVDVNGYFQ